MLNRCRGAALASWHCLQICRGAKSGPKLPVILKQDVANLGKAGDQVFVNQGFAHNWLFPKRLAGYDLAAAHGSRKPKRSKGEDGSDHRSKISAEQEHLARIVDKLLGSPLEVKRRKKRGHIIEGQVTVGSVVDAIAKQKRIEIVAELVELEAPIIQHGTFDVPLGITLPNGERASLKVNVVP